MRLLLDTHALLWWLNDDRSLGRYARSLIADPANDVLIGAISLWEIVIKVRAGKLAADINEIVAEIDSQDFRVLGVTPPHLAALAVLPKHHRDPFDHLLMAQALVEGATFVSDDKHVALYPVPSLACSAAPSGIDRPVTVREDEPPT